MAVEGVGGGSGMEVPECLPVGTEMPSGTYPDHIPAADPTGVGHDGTYPAELFADLGVRAPHGGSDDGMYPTDIATAESLGGADDGIYTADDGIYTADVLGVRADDADERPSAPPPETL